MILLIGIIAFFVLGIVPQLMSQGQGMKDGIGSFYTKIKDYVTGMLEKGDYPFKDRMPESWEPTIEDAMGKLSAYVQEKIPAAATLASEKLGRKFIGVGNRLRGKCGHWVSDLKSLKLSDF